MVFVRLVEPNDTFSLWIAPRHQRVSDLALWLLLAEVDSAVQPKGDTTMAKLVIIASNAHPEREVSFPETWRLHKENNTTEVHVTHDGLKRPFVRDKVTA
jgi:hypothetical protein